MNRVLDRLWIGNARDITDSAPLRMLCFSAIVDLRDMAPVSHHDIPIHHLKNRDGDPWSEDQVEEALNFIGQNIQNGRVLVACMAGMSRSASLVIGYLVRCGFDPPSAFALVKAARPEIAPVPAMLNSVLRVIVS